MFNVNVLPQRMLVKIKVQLSMAWFRPAINRAVHGHTVACRSRLRSCCAELENLKRGVSDLRRWLVQRVWRLLEKIPGTLITKKKRVKKTQEWADDLALASFVGTVTAHNTQKWHMWVSPLTLEDLLPVSQFQLVSRQAAKPQITNLHVTVAAIACSLLDPQVAG